jgi:hypothetical protein
MFSKITNSLVLSFCGLFLGGMAGYFLFSGIHFLRYFLFFAIPLLLSIFIYKVLRTIRNFTIITFVNSLFSTLFVWYMLCCSLGLIWLFFSEGVEFDDLDTIVLTLLMILSMIVTGFLLPVRMIWFESRIGQAVDKILTELKPLMGMKK